MDAKSILLLVAASWAIKILLIPAYYSTDFAVHQNWLRITYNLPLSQWYYDDESKWTLDYPPLFAYFEWLLSIIAAQINPRIVETINQQTVTVYFQRISVMATDLLYLASLLIFSPAGTSGLRITLLYLSPCFLLLDNIHFQYNIMLQAILVASVGLMLQKRYLLSALAFSTLLNFKHIYLYCAPAFFIFLLVQYVLCGGKWFEKLAQLAAVTLLPFIVSFGPFYAVGGSAGIQQIFSRLFPFGRGLVHQYWAPNFWAFYHFLDKILSTVIRRLYGTRLDIRDAGSSSVQLDNNTNTTLKFLPEVTPLVTISIILIVLLPVLYRACRISLNRSANSTNESSFPLLVGICGLIFFIFGFHVHEKAITSYISLLLLFCPNIRLLNAATFVNIVNLLPLLIDPAERTLSILLCLLTVQFWDLLADENSSTHNLQQEDPQQPEQTINLNWGIPIGNGTHKTSISILHILQYLIVATGLAIVVYHQVIHPLIWRPSIEFVPLLINSVWAACFNCGWTAYLYTKYVRSGEGWV